MSTRLALLLTRAFRSASGCLLWSTATTDNPYGQVSVGGRIVTAARAVWTLQRGDIPDGMQVCHRCDTPACVDVEHLFLGTLQDNKADEVAKGRHCKGERQHLAKLTEPLVREIRTRMAAGETADQLAAELRLSKTTVARAARRKTWAHVA